MKHVMWKEKISNYYAFEVVFILKQNKYHIEVKD